MASTWCVRKVAVLPSPLRGEEGMGETLSTGSASGGFAAAPLHPWLHSDAPPGRSDRRSSGAFRPMFLRGIQIDVPPGRSESDILTSRRGDQDAMFRRRVAAFEGRHRDVLLRCSRCTNAHETVYSNTWRSSNSIPCARSNRKSSDVKSSFL